MRQFHGPSLVLSLLLSLGSGMVSAQAERKPVNSQTDLPRHAYPVSMPASAFVNADEPTFNAFVTRSG